MAPWKAAPLAIFIAGALALAQPLCPRAAAATQNAAPATPDPIVRARHLSTAVLGCESCHGADLGGALYLNDPATVVLWAPNLTYGKGGFFAAHGERDFERAVRRGIGPAGEKLLVMPAWNYAALSTSDYTSIANYVRTFADVDRNTPPAKFGPRGQALIASGEIRYDADVLAKSPLPAFDSRPAVSAGYGAYLARIAGCEACHGADLSGTPGNAPPHAPNLTPWALRNWTAVNFVTAIRTGTTPAGSKLSDEMPWRFYANMTNDELHALYAYLKSLPPRPAAAR